MLTHPTLYKLERLKFTGMTTALTEPMQMPDIEDLTFEERLGLLIDWNSLSGESTPNQPPAP